MLIAVALATLVAGITAVALECGVVGGGLILASALLVRFFA